MNNLWDKVYGRFHGNCVSDFKYSRNYFRDFFKDVLLEMRVVGVSGYYTTNFFLKKTW